MDECYRSDEGKIYHLLLQQMRKAENIQTEQTDKRGVSKMQVRGNNAGRADLYCLLEMWQQGL